MTDPWQQHRTWTDYEVSHRGQVRRLVARRLSPAGLLVDPFDYGGYECVGLSQDDLGGAIIGVAVLVLETFDGPRPSKQHVAAHGPGGPRDNRWPENLYWATRSQNMGADRLRDGTDNGGERHGLAKLTAAQVVEIRARWAAGGETQLAIAADYPVDNTQISRIVKRETWRCVP